jgi:hypothetical protein
MTRWLGDMRNAIESSEKVHNRGRNGRERETERKYIQVDKREIK